MTQDTAAPARFIGCDVAKAGIVVFDSRDGGIRTIRNQPDDLAACATGLDHTCLAVCEATGGHEAALLSALMQAGRAAWRYPVSLWADPVPAAGPEPSLPPLATAVLVGLTPRRSRGVCSTLK